MLYSKIEELKSKGLEYSIQNPNEIVTLYKQYGVTICKGCEKGAQVIKAFHELELLKDKKMSKYIVKNKMLIDTLMSTDKNIPNGQYTQANMTDEIAEKLIKNGFGSFFENPEIITTKVESLDKSKDKK